jgi:hypothetical protein
MREIKTLYITRGGHLVLRTVDNTYHTVELFKEVETGETIVRAFPATIHPPIT